MAPPKRVEVTPKTPEDAETARLAELVLNWHLEKQHQARFALRQPRGWLTPLHDLYFLSPEDPGPDPSSTGGVEAG